MVSSPVPATHATIAGRRVVIRRGTKSHTVNVCTEQNEVGSYEARYRLSVTVDLTTYLLEELTDLEALRAWVEARQGVAEDVGAGPGHGLPPLVPSPVDGDIWVESARAATERVLHAVVEEFLQRPYLHRVEHSLHAWMFSLLVQQPELAGTVALRTGEETQVVHNEWPETIPGVKGHDVGPRGLFDLAIVSPDQIRAATLDQFRAGRIAAPIVIEVGLDYGLSHLSQDHDKLLHSEVQLPYLLHLSRISVRDQEKVESLLRQPQEPVCTAYVHLDPKAKARRYKRVADCDVSMS